MDRRGFLLRSGAVAAAATLGGPHLLASAEGPELGSGVFAHGVASGDPQGHRVVLWTRVTPSALATPGSGRGPAVVVRWEVAADAGFARVVRRGRVTTSAHRDHTVKVDADGLSPGTSYWYRFRALGQTSPVGRTATTRAGCHDVTSLRLGVASCANYEGGYFSAYRHLAARDDLDAVLHLGDYLYEYGPGEYGADIGRAHRPAREMVSLADYRQRHAQYKQDPDLAALHQRHPFLITLDDHEVTNDTWRDGAENHDPTTEGAFADRRRRARQAMLEWQPIRPPTGRRLYRRAFFGDLADLHLLDLRRYRDQQPSSPVDPAIDDPQRTITGDGQMAWLKGGLDRRPETTWRFVGNPVMITPVVFPPTPGLPAGTPEALAALTGSSPTPQTGAPYNVDQWDGYAADRAELLGHLAATGRDNVVFVTGDIHSSWAADLPLDPGSYPATSASVAVELVGTSVTSDNLDDITGSPPRTTSIAVEEAIKAANRHVKLLEFDSHGYSVLDVTPDRVQMDWWYVSDRTDPDATESFGQAFQVSAGTNAVTPAAGPLTTRDPLEICS